MAEGSGEITKGLCPNNSFLLRSTPSGSVLRTKCHCLSVIPTNRSTVLNQISTDCNPLSSSSAPTRNPGICIRVDIKSREDPTIQSTWCGILCKEHQTTASTSQTHYSNCYCSRNTEYCSTEYAVPHKDCRRAPIQQVLSLGLDGYQQLSLVVLCR